MSLTSTIIDTKYKVLELIGEGGMGSVYRAHHLMLDKDLALKTIRSNKISSQAFERFSREVRAVAKLDNANIIRVFDSGITEGNQPYYTMELLHGQSLEEKLVKEGALPLDEALFIFKQVADGLKSAHSNGIVHRDLKPANIFLSEAATQADKKTTVKIVDFGIAKLADNSTRSQYLTTAGMVFGSPLYMSPEQSRGEEVDQRSDIYSFGCAFYEALTGRPPLVGDHALETMMLHQTIAPPRLSKRLPGKVFVPLLESLVGKLLQKHPDQRPQSFDEVLESIQRIRKLSDLSTENLPVVKEKQPPPQPQTVEARRPIANTSRKYSLAVIVSASTAAVIVVSIGTVLLGRAVLTNTTPPKQASAAEPAIQTQTLITSKPAVAIAATTTSSVSSSSSSSPITLENPSNEIDPFSLLTHQVTTGVRTVRPIVISANDLEYGNVFSTLSPENFNTIANSKITKLDLRRCSFDMDQLKKLSRLKLEEVSLPITKFNDKGAEILAGYRSLNSLHIDGTEITDKGCISLAKIPSLVRLDVGRTGVTDHGLLYLANNRRLQELRIDNTPVTIAGVTRFCEQASMLQLLYANNCRHLTPDQLTRLQARFPQIKINPDRDKSKTHRVGDFLESR